MWNGHRPQHCGLSYGVNGHLYVADGVGTEVYDYDPGPDGQFGTNDDPAPTHFDVGQFGSTDPEGITYYAANQTLLVLDRDTDRVYEVSVSGESLLQVIDLGAASPVSPAGLTIAPASEGGGDNLYVVARGVDNGSDPNENDGMLYEMDAFLNWTFTDDPVVPGVTTVKAIHFQEMRDRIDALRVARSLGAFNWTDPVLSATTSVVAAVHMQELREALDDVYEFDALPLPTYTNAIAPGSTIRALDITQLRAGIVARE